MSVLFFACTSLMKMRLWGFYITKAHFYLGKQNVEQILPACLNPQVSVFLIVHLWLIN